MARDRANPVAHPVTLLDPENIRLTLFGCGGTGGALLSTLCRLIYGLQQNRAFSDRTPRNPVHGHFYADPKTPRRVPQLLIVDGDTVEEKNLIRQPFAPSDLGKNKALVFASRLGAAYGVDVSAYPSYVDHDTEIRKLVPEGGIAVGCVDNTPTRRILHERLLEYKNVVYIDAGNAGVPQASADAHDPAQPPSREERIRIREGGYNGQVVCGVRKDGKTIMPFPAEQFPDLIEVTEADRLPTEPRCGQVAADLPQRHITNLVAATTLMTFLNSLITEGTILHHVAFFDARRGYLRSTPAIDVLEDLAA